MMGFRLMSATRMMTAAVSFNVFGKGVEQRTRDDLLRAGFRKQFPNRHGSRPQTRQEHLVRTLPPSINADLAEDEATIVSNPKQKAKRRGAKKQVDLYLAIADSKRRDGDAKYLEWQPGGEPWPISPDFGEWVLQHLGKTIKGAASPASPAAHRLCATMGMLLKRSDTVVLLWTHTRTGGMKSTAKAKFRSALNAASVARNVERPFTRDSTFKAAEKWRMIKHTYEASGLGAA